jgi:hypothetical protein
MTAVGAMTRDECIATRKIADFEKFVPYGLKMQAVQTVTDS